MVPSLHGKEMEKQWKQWQTIFSGSKITADGVCSHEIKKSLLWQQSYDQPRHHIKKQRDYFANKGLSSQSYSFSSGHVWIWESNNKEGWVPKNWCFWTVVLEKILESALDCKEIKTVHPKGDQSWTSFGRAYADAEAPVLWPPDAKSQLIRKESDAGKDWRQEEKGMKEVKMIGWHHWLNGHGFEQAPGDGEGQRSLASCSPWSFRESDMTTWLNNKEMKTK